MPPLLVFRVWLRPQDSFLARDGVAHDGEVATRLGSARHPGVCGNHRAGNHAATGARNRREPARLPHFQLRKVWRWCVPPNSKGLPLTCDVSANHVHLSEMDIGFFDANCHLTPPLRSLRDRDALRAGLLDGTIDAICSDHTPVDEDAKQLPFAEAEAGATGLELLLPLVLKWAGTEVL